MNKTLEVMSNDSLQGLYEINISSDILLVFYALQRRLQRLRGGTFQNVV